MMMMNRDDFLFGSNDSYSVNLRDLAIGDSLGSSSDDSAQHKENTLQQLNQQSPQQHSPHQSRRSVKMKANDGVNNVAERNSAKSKRLSQPKGPPLQTKPQPKQPAVEDVSEVDIVTNKFKKKSSTSKKVFKFMNAIVGSTNSSTNSKTLNSMSSPNLRAAVNNNNIAQQQPLVLQQQDVPKGSEFAQTLRRIEDQQQPKSVSNTNNNNESLDVAGSSASGSVELHFHDVYPQCNDELKNSKLIAGVNSLNIAQRRPSGGSFISTYTDNTNSNSNSNPINSGRTTLDSQRTVSTTNTVVPPLEHNSCIIYNLPVT
jgi:hypothetical protein